MDETEAIQQLKRGDFEGLTWLAERFQLKALRAAYLITGEKHLAEDVVQTKFIQLQNSIRGFDTARPFEPWFLRGVVNASVSAVSRRKKEVHFDQFSDESWLEKLADKAETPNRFQKLELEEEVAAGLNALPVDQRAAIVMRYYLQMSEAEMASHSQVAPGTIKWRLNKARERLRAWFGSDPRKEKRNE